MKFMELEIVRADPAGNITVFVLNPPESKNDRDKAAALLMADKGLGAQQVGFVYPPAASSSSKEEAPSRESGWQLEMAGGEFCGNASRSFGLLIAERSGLSGKHTLTVKTSGITQPVPVHIDTEAQTAEIEIPGAVFEKEVEAVGNKFPVYLFEGIAHAVAENMQPDEDLTRQLIRITSEQCAAENIRPPDAMGVMFYDSQKRFMAPVVWTRLTDELVCESSCGSGSAALGVWAARGMSETETSLELAQPGGCITVHVIKKARKIIRLAISGKVTLSKTIRYRVALSF
jgi:diaminopimelate epimerase